ncbi:transposase [Oceanipulchritudo coccoides]
MTEFLDELFQCVSAVDFQIHAYCLLPNHYHLLVEGDRVERLRKSIGLLHGRSSYYWNGEDNTRGRKVWYRTFDRLIHTQRHFYTTLNYLHYNPVKDGYCTKMTEWPWSSVKAFVKEVGRKKAAEIWQAYPPAESHLKELLQ